jgi:hypothetical protein
MKGGRRIGLALLASLLVPGGLVELGARPARVSGAPTPSIRMVARPARLQVGRVFTVEIRARHLRDAGALAFHLVYDPAMIEPVPEGFTEGTLLRRNGARTSFLARPASTGDRVMVGIARLGDPRGTRGRGHVCRLTFRALRPGESAIVFDRARLSDPQAREIQATFQPVTIRVSPGRQGRKD